MSILDSRRSGRVLAADDGSEDEKNGDEPSDPHDGSDSEDTEDAGSSG